MIFLDFEVTKHDWLVVAIDSTNAKEYVLINDKKGLWDLYRKYKKDIFVAYNINYDMYIFKAILLDFDPYIVSQWIVSGKHPLQFSTTFNKIKNMVWYDAMTQRVSLKSLEGFLGHNIYETEVPFDIDRELTPTELADMVSYCRNDVLELINIFMLRANEFNAHYQTIKAFDMPMSYLSKTQAGLASVILGGKKHKYKDEWDIILPNNLKMGKYQHIADWFTDPTNHHYDAKLETEVNGLKCVYGWGGFHAGVEKECIECAEDEIIIDADIAQLYPSLMIKYNLISRSASKPEMLSYMLETSLKLKAEGKKKEREPYKRICNISYGCLGDKQNPLFDPLHRNLVCVYGQLFMTDLLDKIEDLCYSINNNTDGVFFKCKRKDLPRIKMRVVEWEKRTMLTMEYDEYIKYVGKDVNNYVAIQANGKVHCKGAYVKDTNDLDYDMVIINEAIRERIINDVPVEDTILNCTDYRKFQKIVKLSSKYRWVEHEQGYMPYHTKRGRLVEQYATTVRYDNKAYRVFASKNDNDGRLLKCDGVRNPAKFGNTPNHCYIENGDITDKEIPTILDKAWYVDLAKKRLADFGIGGA